jgi:hypothetical protein
MVELTPRQRVFLDKLLELCQEHRGPVHYSDVAAKLGVSRFSAYDMLKVLEHKGFVSSSYALSAGHSGPGRSMVMFSPTGQVNDEVLSPLDGFRLDEDWRTTRQRLLQKLCEARETNPREILNELLTRLPEAKVPLDYCTQMVGVLLLNMQRARARASGLNPFRALAAFQVDQSAGLETLAGLSVGATLSADDVINPSMTQKLLEHAQHYQITLARLSQEGRAALAQFLDDALEVLDQPIPEPGGERAP